MDIMASHVLARFEKPRLVVPKTSDCYTTNDNNNWYIIAVKAPVVSERLIRLDCQVFYFPSLINNPTFTYFYPFC